MNWNFLLKSILFQWIGGYTGSYCSYVWKCQFLGGIKIFHYWSDTYNSAPCLQFIQRRTFVGYQTYSSMGLLLAGQLHLLNWVHIAFPEKYFSINHWEYCAKFILVFVLDAETLFFLSRCFHCLFKPGYFSLCNWIIDRLIENKKHLLLFAKLICLCSFCHSL